MKTPLSLMMPGREIAPIRQVDTLKSRYMNIGSACIKRGFSDSHLFGKLNAATDGQLFITSSNSVPGGGNLQARLSTVDQLATGREESVNEVKFGQLLVWGDDVLPYQDLVAAKYLSLGRTVHELKAAAAVRVQGGSSFEPLGLLVVPDGAISLTRYNPRVTTLDNLLWRPNNTSPRQEENAAEIAGRSLGELHGALAMTHGDAQPKNIAYDAYNQEPVHVDLDGAYGHAHDSTRVWDRMSDDVETFASYQPERMGRAAVEAFTAAYTDVAAQGGEAHLTSDALYASLRVDLKPIAYQHGNRPSTTKMHALHS